MSDKQGPFLPGPLSDGEKTYFAVAARPGKSADFRHFRAKIHDLHWVRRLFDEFPGENHGLSTAWPESAAALNRAFGAAGRHFVDPRSERARRGDQGRGRRRD